MSGKKVISSINRRRRFSAGFTLIEILVVVTLSVMLLLTASTLFMTFLMGSSKTNVLSIVKTEGEYAQNQMEFLLRNAVDLLPNTAGDTCTGNMDEVVIKSIDGGITTLRAQDDESDSNNTKIASISGSTNRFMTSSSVELTSGPIFNCVQATDGTSPYITFTFTLQRGNPNIDEPQDMAAQTFSSSVGIRNF
jgi:prepilin-type N-terminal cleavage/methylation domain-containing protein